MSGSSDRIGPAAMAGMARGYIVHGFTFPLVVMRTVQQDSPTSLTVFQVAKKLFQEGRTKRFYQGFSNQLIEKTITQPITWIGLVNGPSLLGSYIQSPLVQQGIVGLGIAAVNTAITNPIERKKILTVLDKGNVSLLKFYVKKEGWVGLSSNFANSAIRWVTFCVAQHKFTDTEKATIQKPLTASSYVKIALQVSLAVSALGAVTEAANVRRMGRGQTLRELLAKRQFRPLFRGMPLSWLNMFIHNLSSVVLIDYFKKRQQ